MSDGIVAKRCTKCGEWKSKDLFPKIPRFLGNCKDWKDRPYWCIVCTRKETNGRYAKTCQERRDRGICIRCGINKAVDGKHSCEDCLSRQRETHRDYYQKRKSKDHCATCFMPLDCKGRVCSRCRIEDRKEREQRTRLGLCYLCGEPRTGKSRRCKTCADRQERNQKRQLLELRESAIRAYGGKCYCCGESNPRFLTLDHVNNDGYKDKINGKKVTGNRLYRRARRQGWPNTLQLACYNCNVGKHVNGGVCPHKTANGLLY